MIWKRQNKDTMELYIPPKTAVPIIILIALALAAYEALSSILFALLGLFYLYLSTDRIAATPEEIRVKVAPLNTHQFYPLYWNLFLSPDNYRIDQVEKEGNSVLYALGLGGIPISIYRSSNHQLAEELRQKLSAYYRK